MELLQQSLGNARQALDRLEVEHAVVIGAGRDDELERVVGQRSSVSLLRPKTLPMTFGEFSFVLDTDG